MPVCEGEPGHGCGHNLLGAGSVAAAIAVKEYLEKNGKEGTVVFFGCPGEEGGSGKGFMARDGVFDELDFAISWHPATRMRFLWEALWPITRYFTGSSERRPCGGLSGAGKERPGCC